jgi:metallophosphoesterase (TIGR00282 family)
MLANILAVGDVVGSQGLKYLKKTLPRLRREYEAAFTVVNGENASDVGLTPQQAEDMFDAGADVVTLGNHAFRQKSVHNYLDDTPYILRPANYAPQTPGRGFGIFDSKLGPVGVVNLIGRVNMDYGPDNPFLLVDKILPQLQEAKLILVDFHAEATSEKLAMGYMLDGKVTALWGTHTHVPTADAQVLPQGTGYITDLGMTGPKHSVIGIQPKLSIEKFRGGVYNRYQAAEGPCVLSGAVFTVDTETGLCTKAQGFTV